MGKLFLVYPGGSKVYCCKSCTTPVATREDKISNGKTPHGFVFDRLYNVTEKHVPKRVDEADDLVRYVTCKKCHSLMGWRYEFCVAEKNRFKEGRFLLLSKELTLEKPHSTCPTTDTLRTPPHRESEEEDEEDGPDTEVDEDQEWD